MLCDLRGAENKPLEAKKGRTRINAGLRPRIPLILSVESVPGALAGPEGPKLLAVFIRVLSSFFRSAHFFLTTCAAAVHFLVCCSLRGADMIRRLLPLALFFATNVFAQQKTLHLAIGDPARKDKEARLTLDAITATASGEVLTPRELTARLSGTRLLFIGESHTSIDFHRIQLRMMQELQRTGRKVLIGLEMYPRTEQKYLDDWSSGLLTEAGFLQLSQWYKNWGYHWNYYSDIFLFARAHDLRMFALNAPREVVSAVSRKGLDNLTPEEKANVAPKIDTTSEEHFTLFKSYFEEESGMAAFMGDAQIRSMYASQCTWDATMGYNAVQALKQFGDQNAIIIVLIGSGHVAYGLGIQRQSALYYDAKMASLIPIEVADGKQQPIESVQASFADYIWGIPPEKDSLYPDLGLATVEAGQGDARRKVLSAPKASPVGIAGFQAGDILISLDGTPLRDREDLNRLMAEKRWGDAAEFVVRRTVKDGTAQEIALKVVLRRRSGPAPKSPMQ
jgi:uncharacterized iron-regulated protein